jgi:hypothetical protein
MHACVEQNWASVAWLDDPAPSTPGWGVELDGGGAGVVVAAAAIGITTTPVAGARVAHSSSEPYPEIEQLS